MDFSSCQKAYLILSGFILNFKYVFFFVYFSKNRKLYFCREDDFIDLRLIFKEKSFWKLFRFFWLRRTKYHKVEIFQNQSLGRIREKKIRFSSNDLKAQRVLIFDFLNHQHEQNFILKKSFFSKEKGKTFLAEIVSI